MATTTATLSVSSNVMTYPVTINKSMSMMKFQSCHGLEETSGLRTKKFTATAATVVVEQDEFTVAASSTDPVVLEYMVFGE